MVLEKIFVFANHKQELPMAVILVVWSARNMEILYRILSLCNRDEMRQFHRGPYINASYQVSVHLAKRFQRRRYFRNQPTRNRNVQWRSCLLKDRNEMINPYRVPSIDASYQVSVHLAKLFLRRNLFRHWPSSNKNCLWQSCLSTDRGKISNLN
jgi:hypothetical protein